MVKPGGIIADGNAVFKNNETPATHMTPLSFADPAALADDIIARTGPRIVLAMPLGIGKANLLANALYARAAADPRLSLTIVTALTLEKPRPSGDLERRFLNPIVERLFGGCPELAYAAALRAGTLPSNIEVHEFFLLAGRWLGVPRAQQDYISANYTHALRFILDRKPNVFAQLVAKREEPGGPRYSLGSNPDLSTDVLALRAAGKADFLFVGEVNDALPFMGYDAEIPAASFSHLLDSPATQYPLFAPPKEPVSAVDHAIGLHVARLVPDGGTLQIGIGSMGDAVAHGLILRQTRNAAFREAVRGLSPAGLFDGERHEAPFEEGLFGSSEMLVDAFLDLIRAGIVKREVDGAVLHGGFFLGTAAFYRTLRDMPEPRMSKIRMKPISYVNQLYGDEPAKRAARKNARFVNTALMATLLGAIVSDGLEDGRVVSGVGGQYDFVAQAFALEDARSIMALRATRQSNGRTTSNILWTYGHTTIPRHLRDIVVTEYGIADLRGKSDRDVIAALLAISDSRFQPALLAQAKKAGKIEASYETPEGFRANLPARVAAALAPLAAAGLVPAFPFGTDLTPTEQLLAGVLQRIKEVSASPVAIARLALHGLSGPELSPDARIALGRMALDRPSGLKERFLAALLRGALVGI